MNHITSHVTQILQNCDKEHYWKFLLMSKWQQIMGNLACKVFILKIQKKTIVLGVSDSCWMQELNLLSELLKEKINTINFFPQLKIQTMPITYRYLQTTMETPKPFESKLNYKFDVKTLFDKNNDDYQKFLNYLNELEKHVYNQNVISTKIDLVELIKKRIYELEHYKTPQIPLRLFSNFCAILEHIVTISDYNTYNMYDNMTYLYDFVRISDIYINKMKITWNMIMYGISWYFLNEYVIKTIFCNFSNISNNKLSTPYVKYMRYI